MNKIGQYLQQHLSGEVSVSADARRYFATDASIFTVTPNLVVYPRNEQDVRKTARFAWQLAERDRVVPITARGGGSDQTGAAIGNGLSMVFPAHLNRILEFDGKSGVVVVEPGINYGKLQQTLQTHGRFLPPFPASMEYSTIGGAVANNANGERSVKYGSTRQYVKGLRVVLANGEVIATERLSKRELDKKLGLTTFEGEIYRALDSLLDENKAVIDGSTRAVSNNASGYSLLDVRHRDGSLDLTPLFVGSQGTLGLITEVTLRTELYNPETTLLSATFSTPESLQAAAVALRSAHERPGAMEVVDSKLLAHVASIHPGQLKDIVTEPYPAFLLLIEYDDAGRARRRAVHRARKLLDSHGAENVRIVTDIEQQDELWAIRQTAATLVAHSEGNTRALPIIEDGIVPPDRLSEFITGIYGIFERNQLPAALWGHAGDANLHVQPYLNIAEVGDRQKLFKIMDEYYALVISLGGSISAGHGDGRLRGPYLEKMYGHEAYVLFQKVKAIFDPHNILNPGVKINVTSDDIKPLLRQEYSLGHFHQHLPRS